MRLLMESESSENGKTAHLLCSECGDPVEVIIEDDVNTFDWFVCGCDDISEWDIPVSEKSLSDVKKD